MSRDEAKQTAENLAFQWRGTDPMHSTAEVRKAVHLAEPQFTEEQVDDVVSALVPILKRDGLVTPSRLA